MFRKSKKGKPALNGHLVFTKETNQPPSQTGNELPEIKQIHRDIKGWKERLVYVCIAIKEIIILTNIYIGFSTLVAN